MNWRSLDRFITKTVVAAGGATGAAIALWLGWVLCLAYGSDFTVVLIAGFVCDAAVRGWRSAP